MNLRRRHPTIKPHLQWEAFPRLRWTIAAIYCAARTAFTVETYTIPQTDYDYQDDYNDLPEYDYYGQSKSTYHINEFRLQLHYRQRRLHMTIITYGPNKLWTSGTTTAMTAWESTKATKIVYICYGRDDIIIRDYHLQRHHFQDTNWRIQSIDEIWTIRVSSSRPGHIPRHSVNIYLYQQN